MKKNIFSIACVFYFGITSFGFSQKTSLVAPNTKQEAVKVELKGLKNLYKVNDSLFRSEQPNKSAMHELQELGIRTVFNLRNWHSDKNEVKGTNIEIQRLRLKASKITQQDILDALKIIKQSPKPVLVHCLHGSDRTGCIIAAYRMVYENWSKEDAIKEFQNEALGYHETWFPNILITLQNLDVTKIRAELSK
jgi:protein tyrosine/serine phosphatase